MTPVTTSAASAAAISGIARRARRLNPSGGVVSSEIDRLWTEMVRPATLDDAAQIARVHVDSWRTTYQGMLPDDFLASLSEEHYTDRWQRVIAEGSSRVHVAEEPEGIVGFASGGRERAGEGTYAGGLYAIYVLDSAQRQGHGRGLGRGVAGAPRGV